jgi:hypothetical protein
MFTSKKPVTRWALRAIDLIKLDIGCGEPQPSIFDAIENLTKISLVTEI